MKTFMWILAVVILIGLIKLITILSNSQNLTALAAVIGVTLLYVGAIIAKINDDYVK